MLGFSMFDLCLGIEFIEGLFFGVVVFNVFDINYCEYLNRSYRNSVILGIILEFGCNIIFFGKYVF